MRWLQPLYVKESEPSNNEPNHNAGFAKNRTEPKPNPAFTELEPNTNFSKVLRTRTEPNPYRQRTGTDHEPEILRSFPSLVTTEIRVRFDGRSTGV